MKLPEIGTKLKDIAFYHQDDDYKKDYLIRHYLNFLNIVVERLNEEGIKVSNKDIHNLHKMEFGEISIKQENRNNYTVEEYFEFLEKVDNYWNEKLKLSLL